MGVAVAEIRGDDEVWKNDGRRHAQKDDWGRFCPDQMFGAGEVIWERGGSDEVFLGGASDGEVMLVTGSDGRIFSPSPTTSGRRSGDVSKSVKNTASNDLLALQFVLIQPRACI